MKSNFAVVLPWTLAHEGGWSNHKDDPGGATMRGVTQRTFNGFLDRKGLPRRSVRSITPEEILEIYRHQYWDPLRCDDMPSGLDYAMFDFGVNSGVSRAAKMLQKVLGVRQDGIIGEVTLSRVLEEDTSFLIERLCEERMKFLTRLKTWKTFGKGWTRRVVGEYGGTQMDDTGVVDRAMLLASGQVKNVKDAEKHIPKAPAPGKGEADERENAGESSIVRANALQIVTAGGVGVQTFFSSLEGIERTIFLVFVGVVVLLALYTIRKRIQAWADGWR